MALQKREKILVAATGALLVLAVLVLLLRGGSDQSTGQLQTQYDALLKDVESKRALASRGKKAAQRVAEWEKRSLPSDLELSGSLYQNWLRGLVVKAGFRDEKIDPGKQPPERDVFAKFPFTVTGRGNLANLTDFLFDFYRAGHLHKIRSLTITPTENSDQLTLRIIIEALALPGTKRSDTLSAKPSDRLTLEKPEDYRAIIVRRCMEGDRFVETGGLFAAYRPAPPPVVVKTPDEPPAEPVKPPGIDPSEHTFFTAAVAADSRPQAWLEIRTTGEKLRLHEGDPVKVGTVEGQVTKIDLDLRQLILEIDGKSCEVRLGETLHEAVQSANADL